MRGAVLVHPWAAVGERDGGFDVQGTARVSCCYPVPQRCARGGSMRRVAVIGVGMTKFGKHDSTSGELFARAAADAITDAEIAPSAIRAIYYGNVTGGESERQLHTSPLAASLLGLPGIPTTRFENACATSHAAFRHAVMEIAGGLSDVVLVGGAERIRHVPSDAATEDFAYCSAASFEP